MTTDEIIRKHGKLAQFCQDEGIKGVGVQLLTDDESGGQPALVIQGPPCLGDEFRELGYNTATLVFLEDSI